MKCRLCPRMCGIDRDVEQGYCGVKSGLRVAKAMLHHWEEPCISGSNGSGTVFFSGCCLKCCFCQNYPISAQAFGKDIDPRRLGEIFLRLQSEGAHNINLVNPTHYAHQIRKVLLQVRDRLNIPVVYNSGGYERVEVLRSLEGLVDIYLPDLKYMDSRKSLEYSGAGDYFDKASQAILEMYRQTGPAVLDEEGIMERGLIIRHLVLPSGWADSVNIIRWIAGNLPAEDIFVSLMSQYVPFYKSDLHPEINRRLTSMEYRRVVKAMEESGFHNGYVQDVQSAKKEYTPDFNLEGV